MRSATVSRPAVYRVSALFLLVALLIFPVSGQGPGKPDKRDKAELVRAEKLMAEGRWAAARAAFDAAGRAISERRPEIRQALRGAVTCSLKLGDWKGAWERTQTFWRNRTGASLKAKRDEEPSYDEERDYQWVVPNLELVRTLVLELGASAEPEVRRELVLKRMAVDWQLMERLLGSVFDDDGHDPFPGWWWDFGIPGGTGNREDDGSLFREGIPLGPDGRPRFRSTPKDYRSAGGRAEKVLVLLADLEAIDPTPSRKNAARALLTQARIRKTLYGPSTDPGWNHAQSAYGWDERPSFDRGNSGRARKPFWELENNEARTLVAGRCQVVELPQAENPLALLRLLERKYPNSPSVPEAIYMAGVYYQMRQQFDRALSKYRTLRARYPKHPRAALAQKKINAILEPGVLLGRTGFSPAGTRPKLWVAYRETGRVDFTARPFDLPRYIDKEARKDGEPWLLDSFGYNFLPEGRFGGVEEAQQKFAPYLGKDVVRWTAKVSRSQQMKTEAIEAPLKRVGAYLVEASVPGRKLPSRALVILTDLVLVRKILPTKSLVYVADARTGRPVVGQTVRFYAEKEKKWHETRTKTNSDGVVEIALRAGTYGVTALAVSAKGGLAVAQFRTWDEGSEEKPAEEVGYGVTDRPVYRPGDTVRFRLWVRELAERVYRQPRADQRVDVEIRDPQENVLRTLALRTDATGGVAGEFVLSEAAALGSYSIGIVPKQDRYQESLAAFRVEAYKKPDFEVKVEPRENLVRPGKHVRVRVSARYYSGGVLRGGVVRYQVFSEGTPTPAARPREYDWLYGSGYGRLAPDYPWLEKGGAGVDEDSWLNRGEGRVSLFRGEARLGDDGTLDIDVNTAVLAGSDQVLSIEAEVRDLSRRTIRGKGSLVVARQDRLATVELDRGWYRPGERPRVAVGLQTVNGSGVAANGSVRLSRIRFEGADLQRVRLETVHELKRTTGADGRVSVGLPRLTEGQYRVEFVSRDSQGEPVSARTCFWVHGPQLKPGRFRHADLEIIPDRPTYKVGETACLLVHVHQPNARILWSDDARDGRLRSHRFLEVRDHAVVVPVRIEARHVPNLFVEATVVSNGKVHSEACEILVPPVRDLLDVRITTPKPVYRPGEKSAIKVTVTDSAGKPVSGPITLTAYDKAVTYVQDETGIGPKSLLAKRRSEHRTDANEDGGGWIFQGQGTFVCPEFEIYDYGHYQIGAIGGVPPNGGDPADLAPARSRPSRASGDGRRPAEKKGPIVRRNFADTALWRAAVEPGPDGTATVKVSWPDSLTTWRLRADVVTKATQVGNATAEVTTTKNLLVRLHTPRFLVERDEVVLAATVRNALPTDQQVQLELNVPSALIAGAKSEAADGSGNLRLTAKRLVKAGSDARVDWPVRVLRAGNATVTVKAVAKDEGDAMQVTLPVLPYGVERGQGWAGALGAGEKRAELSFTVPEKADPDKTGFDLGLSPGPIGAMLDALPMLIGYPYGCTEQSMSRFYPTILAANTLKKLGVKLEALAGRPREKAPRFADRFDRFHASVFDSAEMDRMAESGLNRLCNFQHKDGGWGWWPDDVSTPYMTAYVLNGLQLTRQAGHAVRQEVMDNACEYLFQAIALEQRRGENAEAHRPETDAFVVYVLSWAVAHKGKPGGMRENPDSALLEEKKKDLPDGFPLPDLDPGPERLKQLRLRLFQERKRLNPYGQALLALALRHAGDKDRARTVLRDLLKQVKRNPKEGTAHIPTATESWWFWYNSAVETNAWALRAVLAIEPRNELASGLAQWLVLHRHNGTWWQSTRDSALAVAALADYVLTRKGSGADCRVAIRLDGKLVREVTISSKELLAPDHRLFFDGTKLTPGKHSVTLQKTGGGELQFSARFRTFAKQETIEPAGNGLRLKREYFSLGADGSKRKPLGADSAVPVGDVIEVVLTINADKDCDYLAFTDPKPAGCEPVELQSGGVWLDQSWANVELRDQGVIFFLPWLNRGQHVLRYRLRAEMPGTFQVLPASGFAMYAPQIQASSAGGRLVVR